MAATKQTKAALENVTKAHEAARSEKTIAHMSEQTRTALDQQGAAAAEHKRTGGDPPRRGPSSTRSPSGATCLDVPRWAATNSPASSARNRHIPAKAAVRADGDLLVLETLFFADEVREPHQQISNLPGRLKLTRPELRMAPS
jgi:hypothetical protein